MRHIRLNILLFCTGMAVCIAVGGEPVIVETRDGIEIRVYVESDDSRVLAARDKLVRVLKQHALQPWIMQHEVVITAEGLPHSHPVLTLTTESEYFDDDLRQLSTFIHEQLHWYVDKEGNRAALKRAISRLRGQYPEVPVGQGQGARSEYSTYLHLIVNWLELDAGVELLGEAEARRIVSTHDHYRWIFERVLEDTEAIGTIIAGEGLAITPGKGLPVGQGD